MAKSSGATKEYLQLEEFWRLGGKKIPAGFAKKAMTASKALRQKQLKGGLEMQRQGAKLYGRLKGVPTASNDPANKTVIAEMLSFHKKLASRKLAFSKGAAGNRRNLAWDDFRDRCAALRFCGHHTHGARRADSKAGGFRERKWADQCQRRDGGVRAI